jgi:hypothetical protein
MFALFALLLLGIAVLLPTDSAVARLVSLAGVAILFWPARWAWKKARVATSGPKELGPLADQLAEAVREQWKAEAFDREVLPAPIPVRWQQSDKGVGWPLKDAADPEPFKPLEGVGQAEDERLQAVRELYQLYADLGSGRLVITGGPGWGKTGAAMLLILVTLDQRSRLSDDHERTEVPVPVMFPLNGWDPDRETVQDWLTERLSQAYPMFEGVRGRTAARSLLAAGKIAVILDGLDEIPTDTRPAALAVLSRQATTFRLVLLTRTKEMIEAAKQELLQRAAAIELQDIDPHTAAAYLESTKPPPPPEDWARLISYLPEHPHSPLAQALNNPLMLTIVRDIYRHGGDPGGLLPGAAGDPGSAEDIEDYLLDRVVPDAYAQRPGETLPYDGESAKRALQHIAARMNADNSRDLQWWRVPAWTHAGARRVASGLVCGLTLGLVGELTWWLLYGPKLGPVAGVAIGFISGFAVGALGSSNRTPRRRAPLRWPLMPKARRTWYLVLHLGLGLAAGLAAWRFFGPQWAFVLGLVTALASWLINGVTQPETNDTTPLDPPASWRGDWELRLGVGLTLGLVTGLVWGLQVWLRDRPTGPLRLAGQGGHPGTELALVLVNGLAVGLVAGCVVGLRLSATWDSSFAFAQLTRSDGTPVRLIRFLEDARKRHVLRTVGPVYQFRHARLQDRLAGQESAHRPRPDEPSPAAGSGNPLADAVDIELRKLRKSHNI